MEFELKTISIEDKPLFDKYFAENNGINSEYTFTNMFMWRNSYNIRYAIIDGFLCIFAKHGTGAETVNFPIGCGDITPVFEKLSHYFAEQNQRFLMRVYSNKDMDLINTLYPDTFIFTQDRNSFDYVYKVQDLSELQGSKYHAKKNHINRFVAQYPYEYKEITDELIPLCHEMFDRWCDSKMGIIDNISEQKEAVSNLLKNYKALGVKGGAIMVEGKMVAFSFGEVLSEENSMVVIHLEHADTEYQGSFPLINQQFLLNSWQAFEYVNREEDMGLAGLRQAKKSYKPCMMVKKFIASPFNM